MLHWTGCLLAVLALTANAQLNSTDPSDSTDPIEPTDFNVTQALVDLGVNVTELPVDQLVERSSNAACSLAVSG